MAPITTVSQSMAVTQPPTAAGFAAWETPNGAARPHTADGMFGQANTSTTGLLSTPADPGMHLQARSSVARYDASPARPPLMSSYSSGSGRVFAYMPASSSDEFASPGGYGSFDSSYSPYQAPDTAASSYLTHSTTLGGLPGSHRSSNASTNTAASSLDDPLGNNGPQGAKKRPRRRYDEIERMYPCNWPGCTKSYGTLNHLNAHVAMQKHGAKRLPEEFKEMRKQWRKTKRIEEHRRASTSRLGTTDTFGGAAGVQAAFTPGVNMGNGPATTTTTHHFTPGFPAEPPYAVRDARMDSFSSAPGGYAGEAGGGGAGHAGGGGRASYYPYHPPAGYGGPRGSTASVYSYATAPPPTSHPAVGGPGGAGGATNTGTGAGLATSTASGQWMAAYGSSTLSANNTASSQMFPPPTGPARSYSMSAAAMPHGPGAWSAGGAGGRGSVGNGHMMAAHGCANPSSQPPFGMAGAYASHGAPGGGGPAYATTTAAAAAGALPPHAEYASASASASAPGGPGPYASPGYGVPGGMNRVGGGFASDAGLDGNGNGNGNGNGGGPATSGGAAVGSNAAASAAVAGGGVAVSSAPPVGGLGAYLMAHRGSI